MSARKPVLNDAVLDRWSGELRSAKGRKSVRSMRRKVGHLYVRYCRTVANCRPSAQTERAAAVHGKKLRRGARIRRRMLHLAAGLE